MKFRFLVVYMGAVFLSLGTQYLSAKQKEENAPLDLETFVLYESPQLIRGASGKSFSSAASYLETIFSEFPEVENEVHRKNMAEIMNYRQRWLREKDQKLKSLTSLIGLKSTPENLRQGYEDRLYYLDGLIHWLNKEPPVSLAKITIWNEQLLKDRLTRFQFKNFRLNPENKEIDIRLKTNWKIVYEQRRRGLDIELEFELGLNLLTNNGYYYPRGFIYLQNIDPQSFQRLALNYPIIVNDDFIDNPRLHINEYKERLRQNLECYYQIIKEYFFSDTADLYALHILVRGRVFTDKWKQTELTHLHRGLAAWSAMKAYEKEIGAEQIQFIINNDWTTWGSRILGNEFDDLNWNNEYAPWLKYKSYKSEPNLRNIYWSTKLVGSMIDTYGDRFIRKMCQSMSNKKGKARRAMTIQDHFNEVTNDSALAFTERFLADYTEASTASD